MEQYSRCYFSACTSSFLSASLVQSHLQCSLFSSLSRRALSKLSSEIIKEAAHRSGSSHIILVPFAFHSLFLFPQIHNWKFPLLSCQFLAPCAPCMLFLSLLRQMEHCLQCTRRFGLVLYLNCVSALYYLFLPFAIDWKLHVEHGISLCMCVNVCLYMHILNTMFNRTLNMVSHCVCVWMCVYVCTFSCFPVTVFEKVTDTNLNTKRLWISHALDNTQQECSSQRSVNKRNSMWQWLKWLKF